MVKELNADDGQQTDAHGQDDGQPQVGLPQSVGRRACSTPNTASVQSGRQRPVPAEGRPERQTLD